MELRETQRRKNCEQTKEDNSLNNVIHLLDLFITFFRKNLFTTCLVETENIRYIPKIYFTQEIPCKNAESFLFFC